MKRRYRTFLRGNTYYAQDAEVGRQARLRTGGKRKTERLMLTRNETDGQPLMNLAMARTYLAAHDPKMVTRTWAEVMERFLTRAGTRPGSAASGRLPARRSTVPVT